MFTAEESQSAWDGDKDGELIDWELDVVGGRGTRPRNQRMTVGGQPHPATTTSEVATINTCSGSFFMLGFLIVLLLDAVVILGLVYFFNDGDVPEWGTAIATALAIGLGFRGCVFLLFDYIHLFALVPMAMVAAVVLWLACDVPPKKALIVGVLLLVYKLGLAVLAILILASLG